MFVNYFPKLYGKDKVVYNVHDLVHLSQDVELHGNLDNNSCFPFENFLGQIKKLLRKPNSPLQQVVRCVSEKTLRDASKSYRCNDENETDLSV